MAICRAFAQNRRPVKLRFVTYNIHRAIGVDRRFRPGRIVEILRHHDPDVALLQEVDQGAPRSGRLDLGREIAEAVDYQHLAIGHNVTLRRGRYGNATLSRFPITRERNIDLTIDRRKRRGCQHTTLDLGAGLSMEVFNLHLGLSARERERQIGILVRSPEFACTREAGPCVVAGDFNDWRSRLRVIFTEILGFRSASEQRGRTGHDIPTYPSLSPRGALDRVYYSPSLRLLGARRCRLRTSKAASDHLPLIVDLELDSDEPVHSGAAVGADVENKTVDR
jgi:endonuclease/exonuclease/phosphatase family metal-dependent hydrolase